MFIFTKTFYLIVYNVKEPHPHQSTDDGLIQETQCKASGILQLLRSDWEYEESGIVLLSGEGDIIQAPES